MNEIECLSDIRSTRQPKPPANSLQEAALAPPPFCPPGNRSTYWSGEIAVLCPASKPRRVARNSLRVMLYPLFRRRGPPREHHDHLPAISPQPRVDRVNRCRPWAQFGLAKGVQRHLYRVHPVVEVFCVVLPIEETSDHFACRLPLLNMGHRRQLVGGIVVRRELP